MAWYDKSTAVSGKIASAVTVYRFLASDAAGLYAHAAVAGGPVSGLAGTTEANLEAAIPVVVPDGSTGIVEAGAVFANGVDLTTNATGQAVVAASGNTIWGRALEASSAAGAAISFTFANLGVAP